MKSLLGAQIQYVGIIPISAQVKKGGVHPSRRIVGKLAEYWRIAFESIRRVQPDDGFDVAVAHRKNERLDAAEALAERSNSCLINVRLRAHNGPCKLKVL